MPEAPGSLYTAGAGLLEAAGGQASNIARTKQDATNTTVQAGNAASSEVGASQRQMSAEDAKLALTKLEASENQVMITPQIAMGLVKNTGEKDWLTAVGQKMRSDVLLGLYTHGMTLAQAKRSPKFVNRYIDGKLQTGMAWENEDGIQQEWFGNGIAPEKLHSRSSGAASGHDTSLSRADAAFMKSQEKDASFFGDAAKSEPLKATNPDEWNRRHETYLSNQDRYDQLRKTIGKGGAAPTPAPGDASIPDSGGEKFDMDSLFKDLP